MKLKIVKKQCSRNLDYNIEGGGGGAHVQTAHLVFTNIKAIL
jgi:hypothetical protein